MKQGHLTMALATFFLSTLSLGANTHHLHAFNLHKKRHLDCKKVEGCLSLEDLVADSFRYSMESSQQIQQFYQARAAIRIKLGQVLPQINLQDILAAGIDASASIDTGLPLVGFLFPNRWFDLKSTRILKDAEKERLYAVLADRAQLIINLYYDIQTQIWSIRILGFYIKEIRNVLNFFKNKRNKGPYKVSDEDIAILENLIGKLIFKRAYIDSLSADLPQIATAIGLDPSIDWSNLRVEEHNLVPIENETEKKFHEFWPAAQKESPEIKMVKYQLAAAKASKRTSYFDFLDPAANINLGFSLAPRVKSASSQVRSMEISLKLAEMALSNAIQTALNKHNDSLDAFPGIQLGLDRLKKIRRGVNKHINDLHTHLDINRVVRHFKFSNEQALNYVVSYFNFRIAEADLNRYTWSGPVYEGLKDYIAFELPQVLKAARKNHSIRAQIKRKFRCKSI